MTEYRIVSNGINYRVQWLGKTWFLRRAKWYWLRQERYTETCIAEFLSKVKAQKAIIACIKREKAKKQGYIPVTGDIDGQEESQASKE
jgi:hypothetical protein